MAQKGLIKNSDTADVSAENMAAAFHAMIGSSGAHWTGLTTWLAPKSAITAYS